MYGWFMFVCRTGLSRWARQDGKQMKGKCGGKMQDKAHGMEMVNFAKSGVFLHVK